MAEADLAGGSLRERLRRDTAGLHQQIERQVDAAARFGTRADYQEYLARLYGLVMPLERLLASGSRVLPPSNRAALLANDLHDFGLSQVQIEALACADIAFWHDGDAIIGIRYVLDGSALGGKVLLKQYGAALAIDAAHGGHYLDGGAEAMAGWRQLLALLNARSGTGPQADKAVAAANDTFTLFGSWLAK